MAFHVPGSRPIDSTAALAANPSTSAVIAELDSTNFQSTRGGRIYTIHAFLGGSTGAVWAWERATSPNVDSTSILEQTVLWTGSAQTSQFVKKFVVEGHERVRVRHLSSVTGNFSAKLQAEEIS